MLYLDSTLEAFFCFNPYFFWIASFVFAYFSELLVVHLFGLVGAPFKIPSTFEIKTFLGFKVFNKL